MTIDTLVAVPVTLPRVNLLPQEINAADAARRMRLFLAAGLVAVVGVMGYLYMSAGDSVATSQGHLDAAKAATQRLNTQLAQHGTITPLKTEVETRGLLLQTSMSQNVPWAMYMNDVQLGLPRGARLLTWTMQLTGGHTSGSANFGGDGVATWALSGEAKSFEDVARVIESLQSLDAVDSVIVTSATDALDPVSGQKLVTFILATRMNDKAIVPYTVKAGS